MWLGIKRPLTKPRQLTMFLPQISKMVFLSPKEAEVTEDMGDTEATMADMADTTEVTMEGITEDIMGVMEDMVDIMEVTTMGIMVGTGVIMAGMEDTDGMGTIGTISMGTIGGIMMDILDGITIIGAIGMLGTILGTIGTGIADGEAIQDISMIRIGTT